MRPQGGGLREMRRAMWNKSRAGTFLFDEDLNGGSNA